MKIIHKHDAPEFSLPLPLHASIHLADAVLKDGEEFDLFVGITKKYADQLKKLSLDERDADLQNFTGDKKRFGEGSYEAWYKKNRTPFILIDKRTDELAAIIWFGPKPLGAKSRKFGEEKEYENQNKYHTVSFRTYPVFRGRGIMKNFSSFVMEIYKKHFPNSIFWTGTDNRNNIFIKFISALGFWPDQKHSALAENWLVMVKE